MIAGNRFEFRGADQNEWYKGTFTLRDDTDPRQFVALIADCPNQDMIGKTSKVIYRLRDGKLLLAARAPGTEEPPADFNDSESRKFMRTSSAGIIGRKNFAFEISRTPNCSPINHSAPSRAISS